MSVNVLSTLSLAIEKDLKFSEESDPSHVFVSQSQDMLDKLSLTKFEFPDMKREIHSSKHLLCEAVENY